MVKRTRHSKPLPPVPQESQQHENNEEEDEDYQDEPNERYSSQKHQQDHDDEHDQDRDNINHGNKEAKRQKPKRATNTNTTATTTTTVATTVASTKRNNNNNNKHIYDRDPTTNQYLVYSKSHKNLVPKNFMGNKDFNMTIQAFRYEYLAKHVTKEMKDSMIQYILDQYVFYELDTKQAKTKIFKSIEDRRHLHLDRLQQDEELIQERTSEWAQWHKPSNYVREYDTNSGSCSGGAALEQDGTATTTTSSLSRTRNKQHINYNENAFSYTTFIPAVASDPNQVLDTNTTTNNNNNNEIDKIAFVPLHERHISPYLHEFKNDYNNDVDNQKYYIEELAYHYYYDQAYEMRKQQQQQRKQHTTTHCRSPSSTSSMLEPLPPPPPIPEPPSQQQQQHEDHVDLNPQNHPEITWTYDPTSRIYLVDFSKVPNGTAIPMIQKHFLGTLMERDDITVICEGLYDHTHFINADYMKDFLYDLGYNFGTIPYAKFRQFNRIVTNTTDDRSVTNKEYVTYEEVDGYRSMNVLSEYIPYLQQTVFGEGKDDDVDDNFENRNGKNATSRATIAAGTTTTTTTTPTTSVSIAIPAGCTVIHIDDDDDVDDKDGDDHALNKTNDSTTTDRARMSATMTTLPTTASLSTPILPPNTNAAAVGNADCCIYMTDVEMATYVPRFDLEYKQQFKMKELLPGDKWCLMNQLPVQARPFMGPNLYISPGGGYTQFHQDGHGTVDSGHSCLSGYNEVVMLRRLPECHKRQACQLIPSNSSSKAMEHDPAGTFPFTDTMACQNQAENVLYRLPHDDFRSDKLTWAQTSTIEEWKKLGYCPSVFILKPGQHLLINKGRLHAFRKMTFDELPENDCHAQLRKRMIAELKAQNIHRPPLCISVAFDWSFAGITAEGINRELATTLESAALCRKYSTCKSLAIPETSILRLADNVPIDLNRSMSLQYTHFGSHRSECILSWWEIVRGILPSLRYIVNRDNVDFGGGRSRKIKVSECPDTHLNEAQSGIDPYGNDYFCSICSHELANTYFHCHGCESLLVKDYNICIGCFNDGAYAINVEMHKRGNTPMACHFHHVGKPKAKCSNPAKHDMKCSECNKCLLCNCVCHTVFEKRRRFYTEDRQRNMLERCTELARDCEIKYAFETEYQLYGEPLVARGDHQDSEIVSSTTGDVRSSQSQALRIVADVCQQKQNRDHFNHFNEGDDVSVSGLNGNCSNLSSETKTRSETQLMDIQGPYETVERGQDVNELSLSKTQSHSIGVIDVDDDNDVSMDSDSSKSAGILNLKTGEIQNVHRNSLGVRNQSNVVDAVHPIPSEDLLKTTSHSAVSPTATIFEDSTFSTQPPCIVPVGTNEDVEYDAV